MKNMIADATHFQEEVGTGILAKKVQSTKELLECFSYSCSHGIRSPLKSMAGLVMLMKTNTRMTADEETLCLSLLNNSVKHQQSILCHFHDLKLNSRTDLVSEKIQVRSLLTRILKGCRSRLGEHKITLEIESRKKSELWTQKQRLEIVLTKLLSNAITFQDKRNKDKKISVFVTTSSAGCSIVIIDNGIGIDVSAQQKMFDLFYRGTNESTGAGLGLFVVRQVIEKMNGIVQYKASSPGSTFSIWIPNDNGGQTLPLHRWNRPSDLMKANNK